MGGFYCWLPNTKDCFLHSNILTYIFFILLKIAVDVLIFLMAWALKVIYGNNIHKFLTAERDFGEGWVSWVTAMEFQ